MPWESCNYTILQLIAHILLLCSVCKIYRTINQNVLGQSTFDIQSNLNLRTLVVSFKKPLISRTFLILREKAQKWQF